MYMDGELSLAKRVTDFEQFCSICGTHVFSKNTGEPDWDIGLNVGQSVVVLAL